MTRKELKSYGLIEYSSLPEQFCKRCEAKYGKPKKQIRQARPTLVINAEARRFFTGLEPGTFRLPNGETLPEDKIKEYTLNASVLDVLHTEAANKRQKLKNSSRIWEHIQSLSERLRANLQHTLPHSEARLKDKVLAYGQEGFTCLISKKFGNTNRTQSLKHV